MSGTISRTLIFLTLFATNAMGQSARPESTSVIETANQDAVVEQEVRATLDQLIENFNSAKSEDIANIFLPSGELIDEAGQVYKGRAEIKELLGQFFAKFPGATVATEIKSVRSVGPIVIMEGTRMTTRDEATSQVQFTGVFAKSEQGWRIASLRDFPEQTLPTPGEQLTPLNWLVGAWINEGADARVKIDYRWSEDGHFLLGEFQVMNGDAIISKTSQRIAWDPVIRKPRSWLFDSDGGFSEAIWTDLDDGRWILRSTAVLPDGTTGAATLIITPVEPGRFTYAGKSRLIGNALEDDFELTIVKQPPTPNGK